MTSRLSRLLLGFAVAACGARTQITDGSGTGGSSHASTTSASSTGATSTSSAGGGGSGGSPCTWGFGPEVQLVDAPNHVAGAAVDGDHLLLMTSGKAGYAVSTLSLDVSLLGAPLVLAPTQYLTNIPVLAAGYGHAVALSSGNYHGCYAVGLDPSGNALGSFQPLENGVPTPICAAAIATPSGFVAFAGVYTGHADWAGAPARWTTLDADGHLENSSQPILLEGVGNTSTRLAAAVVDDGSVVVLDPGTKSIRAQRVSAQGDPLTDTKSLSASGDWLALVSLGSTVVVAWNDEQGAGANEVRAATLDASLHLGPSHVVVAASNHEHVNALVDGGPGPGKLLVTSRGSEPASAQWIAADGTLVGGPFASKIASEGLYPIVVATPSGPIAFGDHSAQRVLCQ
jgi:hypothetical protein